MVNELNNGAQFKIFCGDSDLHGEHLDVKVNQWISYNSYTQVYYATRDNRSNRLHAEIERSQPDVLYIVGLFSWHFNLVPMFFSKTKKKILSVRGMLHSGALTQKKIKKQSLLQLFRLTGLHKKILFHATDLFERDEILKNFSKDVNISVASNFPRMLTPENTSPKRSGSLKMVCISLVSRMKNHLLVLRALSLVNSNVIFDIYGPIKDMEYWQECLIQINLLGPHIKVNYHGDIQPALVPPVLQHAELFVMPSKSENFGHALVEALSAGVPVITSAYTPWNELEKNNAGLNVDEDHLKLAEAIEKFAAMDEEEFAGYRKSASDYIQNKINIPAILNEYREMFELI